MPKVKKLAEGVRLCTVQTDRFKTSKIRVAMAMPMSSNLSANALMLFLLKRTCRRFPDFAALNCRLDELYGACLGASVSKLGEAQVLTLDITCIDDRFALGEGESISTECAELLTGLLFEPNAVDGAFVEADLQDEKRLLLQRMEEEMNDKRAYAMQRCEELLCQNELYGQNKYGTPEEVAAVTAEEAYAAWQNVLKTAVIMITAVNGTDGKGVEKVFAACFKKTEREPAVIDTEFRPKAGRFRRVCETFKVNQGKLVMGFRTGMTNRDDCFAAETVMNDLFGGNVYSKLFLNVREKLSLCYYCWSRLASRKGIVLVHCGIDTENEKKASAEILAQLNDMRSGKFSDEDIAASKMGLRENYMSNEDSPGDTAAWYCSQVLDEKVLTPAEVVKMIDGVTKEEICAAAKRMGLETIYMLCAEEGTEDENN